MVYRGVKLAVDALNGKEEPGKIIHTPVYYLTKEKLNTVEGQNSL